MSNYSKSDATKALSNAKLVVDILQLNKLTNSSLAAKYIAEAMKNQQTIIIVK